MRNVKEDPIEKVAMLSLFESCNTICCLGFGDYDVNYSDIEYALSINHAGRKIVESGGRKEGRRPSLPLSLWPIILERAYKKSGHIHPSWSAKRETKNATGLSYLVREVGPALIGRHCIACTM